MQYLAHPTQTVSQIHITIVVNRQQNIFLTTLSRTPIILGIIVLNITFAPQKRMKKQNAKKKKKKKTETKTCPLE